MQKNRKPYLLEDRTLDFAKRVVRFCKEMPNSGINKIFLAQLLRSSSSVGANYIEANESLGKKDLIFRLKFSRKECKEAGYWLKLILTANPDAFDEIERLGKEVFELRNIFSAIINKLS